MLRLRLHPAWIAHVTSSNAAPLDQVRRRYARTLPGAELTELHGSVGVCWQAPSQPRHPGRPPAAPPPGRRRAGRRPRGPPVGDQALEPEAMNLADLLAAVAVGVLAAVVLGGLVWSAWCDEQDQAARRAHQHRLARQQPEPSEPPVPRRGGGR